MKDDWRIRIPADSNLKILDLQREVTTVLTSDQANETAPVWSSDGSRTDYRSDGVGGFVKDATGAEKATKIYDRPRGGPLQVIDDPVLGRSLLFFAPRLRETSQDVVLLPLTGTPEPRAVVATPFADVEPQVSPDPKWLAYASSETGRLEVYIQPFPPDGKRRWRISTAGGRQPLWRADGRELFFVSEDRQFYAVGIDGKPESFDTVPTRLFEMPANVTNTRNSYVPSRDGRRFLVNMVLDSADVPIKRDLQLDG